MDPATRRALNRVNARFYRERARDFSDRRPGPWPGWDDVLPHLDARVPPAEPLRVLDVGCGNARFAGFVRARRAGAARYDGVDASDALLRIARARFPDDRFHRLDVVESDPDVVLPRGPFDLVVLFGVLHHVPGFHERRALLRALLRRLSARGLLAVTLWGVAELERFRRRLLPWSEARESVGLALDPGALEPDDVLLRWGDAGDVRYFHLLDADELERLAGGLPARRVAAFDASEGWGTNRYVLWERDDAGAA